MDNTHALLPQSQAQASLDADLNTLAGQREAWVQTPAAERIAILGAIRDALMPVAPRWVDLACRSKGIAHGSELEGEEWLSGPYAIMTYCNLMQQTLAGVQDKAYLDRVPLRALPTGQVAARVMPHSLWDHLLFSGVKVDVWMQPGVTAQALRHDAAAAYDPANPLHKTGRLALVLGAGNINAIAPLDALHKLFAENEVVLLKLNPVNDYLLEVFASAFKPLLERGVLRIVRGATDVGQYLCQHPLVETLHITGSGVSHDAIVWGTGPQAQANKARNMPLNKRPITSELGAVCPTIVVPGPWSDADIRFQTEHVATQKLHNCGFNCIACQVLVMPTDWEQKSAFVAALEQAMAQWEKRRLYYPGVGERLQAFKTVHPHSKALARSGAQEVVLAPLEPGSAAALCTEVFGPAMTITEIGGSDAEAYLRAAIQFANTRLPGTLGANIIIHPDTLADMGRTRFDAIISELHYGTIGINAWAGLGFLLGQAAWGAFPGHTLADVQSGMGVVHNTFLLDHTERNVVEAPFRPFPRNLLGLSFTLLPRPPWFITHRSARTLGPLLLAFQYRPSLWKLPRILYHALKG